MLIQRLLPALIRPQQRALAGLLLPFTPHSAPSLLHQPRSNHLRSIHVSAFSFWHSSEPATASSRRNYSATAQSDRQTDRESTAANGSGGGGGGSGASVEGAAEDSAAQLMKETIAKHNEEMKEVRDKYLRALAETENVRQRLTRQVADAKQFGIQSFVKDLLEVSDILSKAMETIPKEAFAEKNAHFSNLYEGLRLTEAQMNKVFAKHGLEKMVPVGEPFDPNEHEALFEAPAEGKETGTVLTVTQPGFKLNKRVVRPARVGVVRNG
ncbi:putative GrpE protein-like protein 1, mitochondrial [Hypsibius exemplaris]|uniref:GrpE protein homolog n=1 Tax=Hypsibius exemplaris TaxID=2072580 RepID=A0A1W0XB30_HYPEX|nr:putative GrpE protein-like protein 1, mitochondrial [Hypsibius exemplaris]